MTPPSRVVGGGRRVGPRNTEGAVRRTSDGLRPPIILLGNTRSGTTIVQKVMAAHPDVVGWYEPNALWLYADPTRKYDEFDESDATQRVTRYIRKRFVRFQRRHGDRVILEKSPQNILRIPYVRAIFPEATYLYIVRSPFSFISSVEFKWQSTVTPGGILRRLQDTPPSQLHHWVRRYLSQQFHKRVLKRKYLSMWGPRYRGVYDDLADGDLMRVIAKQWSECSRQAERALGQFGDGEVLRLRYEDFVEDPIPRLEAICAHCGLEMTDEMTQAAADLVKADRQTKWRRFDPEELARLLPLMQEEMERHGYDVPAEIAEATGGLALPS